MPGVGFRICSIVWREVFNFFLDDNPFDGNDDEDGEESDEEDDDDDIDHVDVRDTMRTFVKSAVISDEEEKNITCTTRACPFLLRSLSSAPCARPSRW